MALAGGELPAGTDPALESARLLALANGLGASVLVGQCSKGEAEAAVGYHLGRLFTHGSAPPNT